MSPKTKLKLFLGAVVGAAAVATVAVLIIYPPPSNFAWLIAFATLLALAILSALLALKITEGGSTTAMDFVPQLGAILLLGPAGAVALTAIEQLFTEFLLLKKSYKKALFNTGQVVLSVAAASVLYLTFGGTPGLDQLRFTESFPPFLVGVIGYFTVNTVLVSNAIALTEESPFVGVWRRAAGGIIVFDVVMSPLAYVVAFLYVQWGAIALLTAIIPIIGLRYSYGVNIELQQLSQDLLRVLIRTLEARDTYTSGHSLRVSERSRRIATVLRLKPKQIRLVETAALLHDIGKIDMAYGEILRQAGPLTPKQRELIQAHPDKGVEIVSPARAIDYEVLRCIRHHHEWYDGSGYPLGLAGDEIPIGARIIMICDSIDAMVTDRPYRAALSVDGVRQELTRNSGTQFDPEVVAAVFATGILEEIEAPPLERTSGPATAAGTARV
jgi:putative nucleotidyltransferase with HDIG domain